MKIKVGINGMGRIGRALAKLAKAFGMEVHYRNRSKLKPDLEMGSIYHQSIKSLFLSGSSEKFEHVELAQISFGSTLPPSKFPPTATLIIK